MRSPLARERMSPHALPVGRRRLVRAAALGLVGAAGIGCRPADARAPLAPTPAPARPSPPGARPAGPEATPSADSTRATLLGCVPSPTLAVRPGCSLAAAEDPATVACLDLHPEGSPDVDVLSVVVTKGPYDFARRLGIPSMQATLTRKPGSEAMFKTYRDFEGPNLKPLPDGRQIVLESRGLMLGGVVHWATLPSPRATFTTVLVQQIPLHDAPLADADRAAVEGFDLPVMIECLDARSWPESSAR